MSAQDNLSQHQFFKGHARLSKLPTPTQPVDEMRVDDIAAHLRRGGQVPPLEIQSGHVMNGNHRYAALRSTGAKTHPVAIEGKKPTGMLYSQPINEHEFEDLAGYTHEEDM